MDGSSGVRLEGVVMRLATDVVKAAYNDAMRRHGMLASTIALISTYAEENLHALEAESGDVPSGARAHFLDGCPECGGRADG